MSKRDGTKTTIKDYRDSGISPDALFNYLALLGYGIGGNQEIFTKEELIQRFSIDRFKKYNSKFDEAKLNSFNKKYSRK